MWELDYKAERRRIDAFELWCWRRLLRVPWTAGRLNHPKGALDFLKEISPEYSLEGLTLKLKLQYFGHLMWRADLFEKPLMLGEIEGRRRRGDRGWGGWMASLTWWTWVWVNSGSWWWTGRPSVMWFMGSRRVRHNWASELNWSVCVSAPISQSHLALLASMHLFSASVCLFLLIKYTNLYHFF